MTILLYCVLSWLFMSFVLWHTVRRLRAAGWFADKLAWIEVWLSLRYFLLAPVLLPLFLLVEFVAWAADWRGRQRRRQFRHYRDYEFDPVRPGDLNRDILGFFDKHTEPLEDLQFGLIGDYWLWRGPLAYVEREFISADGRTFAAISVMEHIRNIVFHSVLTDGSYLETSLVLYDGPESHAGHRLYGRVQMEWFKSKSVKDVFARHERRLDKATQKAISYQPADVRAVMVYYSRLTGQVFFADSRREEVPRPELPRPRLSPV